MIKRFESKVKIKAKSREDYFHPFLQQTVLRVVSIFTKLDQNLKDM